MLITNVYVNMVIMKMVVVVVLVYLNVTIVKVLLTIVLYVLQKEYKIHHIAHVMMDIMKLQVIVMFVLTDVNYVLIMLITVIHVLLTVIESINQLVTVQKDTMMMDTLQNVKYVTIHVKLVMIMFVVLLVQQEEF